MSTEIPSTIEPVPERPFGGPAALELAWQPPPRLRFQHRYTKHVVLLALTLFTTSFAPAFELFWSVVFYAVTHPRALGPAIEAAIRIFNPRVFAAGLSYSLPLLTILGAHELGHYFLCRKHKVDATLPYFIPLPLPPTGTLGAVIRIREAFPSKRALFDIGIAGPIAGFIALLPFLYIGLSWSQVAQIPRDASVTIFGDPLLLKALAWLRFGPIPKGSDVIVHPMAFAAWFGMLATALNLLPFGQLDGGHISYALFGRRASYVSLATLGATILMTLRSASWMMTTIMMLVMAYFLGIGHPRILDEDAPLDPKRRLLAAFALVMFILCFTPVPIQTFFR